MGTVSRKIAEDIAAKHAAGKGASGCTRIVKYRNMFDGSEAFGLVERQDRDQMKYERGGACLDPQVWWTLAGRRTEVE